MPRAEEAGAWVKQVPPRLSVAMFRCVSASRLGGQMRPDRVLIVDDDGATRRGTTPPDLLITDIRLDAYNGLQLILNSPHQIPTIVITGFADPVLEAEARRGGAAYLVKPVQPRDLLALVGEKLAARHFSPGKP